MGGTSTNAWANTIWKVVEMSDSSNYMCLLVGSECLIASLSIVTVSFDSAVVSGNLGFAYGVARSMRAAMQSGSRLR